MDLTSISNENVCSYLASRIRASRVKEGYTQAVMANKCGISLRTYKRIELTGVGSIVNLIIILRTLGRIRAVEVLFANPIVKQRPSITDRAQVIAETARKNRKTSIEDY